MKQKRPRLCATLAIRLDRATLEALQVRADRNDRPVSHEARQAIKAYLEAHGKRGQRVGQAPVAQASSLMS